MDRKAQHEDQALAALIAALQARGHQATIVAHPDRDPTHPLTVDALIDVDGQVWAVDHAVVSRESDLVPALDSGYAALRGPLEAIARQHDRALTVSFRPQRRDDEAAYYVRVLDIAATVASTGEARFDPDGFTTVQIASGGTPGDVELTAFQTMTDNAAVADQVHAGLHDALNKKLTAQLKRAKDGGHPVMLLLDKNARPETRNGTVWVAHPATIAQAIQPVLREHPGIVDLVWVVDAFTREAALALGNLPSPPAQGEN